MKKGDLLEPQKIEWRHWGTPEFKSANAQLEKARKKQGPFAKDANVKIITPACGPEPVDSYSVYKAASNKTTFRSERTGIVTTGEQAFKKKFGRKVCPHILTPMATRAPQPLTPSCGPPPRSSNKLRLTGSSPAGRTKPNTGIACGLIKTDIRLFQNLCGLIFASERRRHTRRT